MGRRAATALSRPTPHRAAPTSSGRAGLLRAAAVGLAVVLVGLGLGLLSRPDRQHPVAPRESALAAARKPVGYLTGTSPTAEHWRRILQVIDDRRALAWRRGDPTALAAVYVPGSAALAADRRMLASYHRRGLRVSGASLQFLTVVVAARRVGMVELRVLDRLGAARAHGDGGTVLDLPHDRPTAHRVEIRRIDGQWRIARVGLA